MVYCGKPSTGCQACRDRKTRCDRLTPSCSQCVRAKRVCPGYRNQLDLMFRNESNAVIEKAKARAKSKKAKASSNPGTPSTSSAASPSSTISHLLPKDDSDTQNLERELAKFSFHYPDQYIGGFASSMLPPALYALPPTIHERAQGYFYTNSSLFLRNFDLLGTLCSQTSSEDYLLASMSAVGLASLSHVTHSPEMVVQSRKDYIAALRLTNAALKSPTDVRKDSTLFTVMILSIFETITGVDGASLGAWTKHIEGATALVKLRGAEQFNTVAGQRMFLQVMSNLMLSSVQRTVAIPAEILELREKASKFMDPAKPAWQISEVIIDYTIFRAAVRNCEILGPRAIVEAALVLDRRFIEIYEALSEEFSFNAVYTSENPELIWNGFYHQYQNHWTSQIWNGMRTCRILLHETIRDQVLAGAKALNPVFTEREITAQNESSVAIMLQLQADILASVPQHTRNAIGKQATTLLEGSQGYFILWPLYLVGVMDLATETVRQWVIRRLRLLASNVGILQANVLAEYIEQRKEFEEWKTKPTPKPVPSMKCRNGFLVYKMQANGQMLLDT
ncbi:hypothetical protein BGZ60DRAFT_391555 [Tricladium varicosporioides]|nr:hypothetical protein BGZ60DRAFT_391555 [Hymenoscyphus varicosporioides]